MYTTLVQNNSNIINLKEDEIINFDNFVVGFIYIKKKKNIWKKKYFILNENLFEYWKSNKDTIYGRKRIKEKKFIIDYQMDLSCMKEKISDEGKQSWSFKLYKNDKLFLSFQSYKQLKDVYEKMKKYI